MIYKNNFMVSNYILQTVKIARLAMPFENVFYF